MTKDFSIKRPDGRADYQLLYIYNGFGDFFIDGKWKKIEAGSIVLYHPFEPQLNSDIINKLLARLNKHYMEAWDVSMMANFCHLSPDYFSHQFKKATGVSPIQFLNRLRIEQAKEMLLTGNLTVAEVSELVGYKDPLYFSRIFKKITGFSPKMFHGNLFTEKSNL